MLVSSSLREEQPSAVRFNLRNNQPQSAILGCLPAILGCPPGRSFQLLLLPIAATATPASDYLSLRLARAKPPGASERNLQNQPPLCTAVLFVVIRTYIPSTSSGVCNPTTRTVFLLLAFILGQYMVVGMVMVVVALTWKYRDVCCVVLSKMRISPQNLRRSCSTLTLERDFTAIFPNGHNQFWFQQIPCFSRNISSCPL